MKSIYSLILFSSVVLITSCSKTETATSAAETNAVLLAGTKGGSKSWHLASVSAVINGGASQPLNNIPACELDNIFLFSNNATQGYTETEGPTLCTSTDPSTLELGSWAFTDDGKSLLIDATVSATSDQFNAEQDLPFFILSQGEPLTVSQLTATTLVLTYPYTDTSNTPSTNYVFTITFTKI